MVKKETKATVLLLVCVVLFPEASLESIDNNMGTLVADGREVP